MARPKRPAPLTPADCDLSGLDYMPLDALRLLHSDLFALTSGDEFKAAVALWCRSWLTVPAASLGADPATLARAADLSLEEWMRVNSAALRGFVLCADGRYYHPIIAEKALEAWVERLGYRLRSAKGNSKRHGSPQDVHAIEEAQKIALEKLASVRAMIRPGLPSRKLKYASATGLPEGDLKASPSGSEKRSEGEVEGEGEGEEKSTPAGKVGAASPQQATRAKSARAAPGGDAKGTRLPLAWFPSPELRAVATDLGFTDPEVDEIADEFRDYWSAKPGKDGRKLDWDATWRNWVRKERRHRDARGNGTGARRRVGAFDTEALGPMHAGFVAAVDKTRR